MRKNNPVSRFQQICDAADTFNARTKNKRFWPMSKYSGHYLVQVGLYDYQTKKYILKDTRSPKVGSAFDYMENLIASA